MNTETLTVPSFLKTMNEKAPLLTFKVEKNYLANQEEFNSLGNTMLSWAQTYLKDDCANTLVAGYKSFVSDVNRSQMMYEKQEHYPSSNYADVKKEVYDNGQFMSLYHWGVYVTTFAWEHHLELHTYFKNEFINRIKDQSKVGLDLGAGSAIWSMLTANFCPNISIQAVDISAKTVSLAQEFILANNFKNKINMIEHDALTYQSSTKFDFALSCFLLEHLEQPQLLLANLNANLKEHGYAFVTAALTASEVDHIFEIKKESEIICMAENAGFRVLSSLSTSPKDFPRKFKFLPRSMGMVLQKKANSIW